LFRSCSDQTIDKDRDKGPGTEEKEGDGREGGREGTRAGGREGGNEGGGGGGTGPTVRLVSSWPTWSDSPVRSFQSSVRLVGRRRRRVVAMPLG
jgi:hypothetical protein